MYKPWRENVKSALSKHFLDVLFDPSCWKVLQLPIPCVHTVDPDELNLAFGGGLSSIWSQGVYVSNK